MIGPSQGPLPGDTQHLLPPAGFEPAVPTSERPQTYALDDTAIGIGPWFDCLKITGRWPAVDRKTFLILHYRIHHGCRHALLFGPKSSSQNLLSPSASYLPSVSGSTFQTDLPQRLAKLPFRIFRVCRQQTNKPTKIF